MIIKCRYCKKEFDKPSHRNQHERDAHKEKAEDDSDWSEIFEEIERVCDKDD